MPASRSQGVMGSWGRGGGGGEARGPPTLFRLEAQSSWTGSSQEPSCGLVTLLA